jgi:hypothetical protein
VAVARLGLGILVLLGWVAASGRWAALAGLSAAGWRWAAATGAILAAYVAVWFTALSRSAAIDVTAILVAGAVITGLLNTAVKGIALPTPNLGALAALAGGAALVGIAARHRVRTTGDV